jgi:hypothetical protein
VIQFHLQPVIDLATGVRDPNGWVVAMGDDEGPLVLDAAKANAAVRSLNATFAHLRTPQSADVSEGQ